MSTASPMKTRSIGNDDKNTPTQPANEDSKHGGWSDAV